MSHIKQFFNFLEKKEGKKKPFEYKLIYEPDSIVPEDLHIKGSLDLYGSEITSLPEGLKVGGDLNLSDTPITSLPKGLKVGGFFWIKGTPLSKNYTEEEIRKMCPGIRGSIYM